MFKNIKIGNIFIWSVMKSMNIMITQSRKKLISETVSGNKIKFIKKIHTNILFLIYFIRWPVKDYIILKYIKLKACFGIRMKIYILGK